MVEPEIVLLLSGPVAAGKTTLRELLINRYAFDCVRSSAHLRKIASEQAGGTARLDLQELGDSLDRKTDYRWVLDDVALPAMRSTTASHRWLFDAVRKKRQLEHFRTEFKKSVFHIHLSAPERILRERYERRLHESGEYVDGAYDQVVAHMNEQESRSLIDVADAIIETHPADNEQVLMATLKALQAKFSI